MIDDDEVDITVNLDTTYPPQSSPQVYGSFTVTGNMSGSVSGISTSQYPGTSGSVPLGPYVIGNGASTIYTSNNTNGVTTTFNTPLQVEGTIKAKDLELDGISVKDLLTKIQDRLAILVPNPAKLEKYAALQAAYDHYKTLDALCNDDE